MIAASNEAVRYEVIARLVGPQSEAMVVSHFRVNLLAVLGENGFGPEALGVDQVPALPYGLPAFAR